MEEKKASIEQFDDQEIIVGDFDILDVPTEIANPMSVCLERDLLLTMISRVAIGLNIVCLGIGGFVYAYSFIF